MKKKVLSTTLIALLISVIAICGTLAWLTDEEVAKNTFTVGNVDITLDEAKIKETTDTTTGAKLWEEDKDADPARVSSNEYIGIYPGAVLPKDPTVTNTGSEPAYVRVNVTVNHWDTLTKAGLTDLSDIFTVADDFDTTWKREGISISDDGTSATYTYRYIKDNGILAPATNTGSLFSFVTIPGALTSADMEALGATLQMDIKAEAIQVQGFVNADAAWSAFDVQEK